MLQSLADGIKLILKEDLTPAAADPILFRLAPYLSFAPVFAASAVSVSILRSVAVESKTTGAFWTTAARNEAMVTRV